MNNVWTNKNSYLTDAKSGDNTLKVDKLWYSFPVGDFKFTVGALVENYYMVETPTRYKPILKAFKLGGYGAAWVQALAKVSVCNGVKTSRLVKQLSTLQPTTWLTVAKEQAPTPNWECSVKRLTVTS